MKIPLPEYFPTASEEVFPLLIIEFGDSYEAPQEESGTVSASESSAKKKGMTVALTTKDMQKRRNDVKARTNLLLALSDEHQLRFSKYKTAQELWGAILKTFGGNDATKKTKKNQLKQQYVNFKAEAKNSSKKGEVNTASIPSACTHVSPANADVAAASISHDTTGKKITIQGTDVAGFDKSKVECFNCYKMGHFSREYRAPKSQDRGRREIYKQGSKVEESAPMALMAIDRVGWDWSYMANKEENHALVADDTALTEFALMAKSSSSSENKVFDNSLCSKSLEKIKKEKEGLDSKLIGFESASKDLDTLLGSQRSDKNKEGLGYSAVLPPVQVYSPPKKDMSWTRLPEFAKDTITDYSRPSLSIESNSSDLQNSNSSVSEHEVSLESILSKPMIKFIKAADSPTVIKTNKVETVRQPSVKYAEMYRNTSKSPKVRGNQRNWNNLKSQQLGKDFVMQNKACFKCGQFDHLAYDCAVWVEQGKN
nr:ribonuclease H-like domain-containing protein [Tanacetum cinerariifolium]